MSTVDLNLLETKRMNFDMSKCIDAFSLALDITEMDLLKINMNHARRVAYISLTIGRVLHFSQSDLQDLYILSLLHDNGMSMAGSESKKFEFMPQHCLEGENNISVFPFVIKRKHVVKYHHENYDGSGIFGISGENIPVFAQIIHTADVIDVEYNLPELETRNRREVELFVKNNKNKLFSPVIVDAFLSISHKERFWSDLSFYNMTEILDRISPKIIYSYTWKDILPVSQTFMNIIDSKSKFTYRHSQGITNKIDFMSQYYQFDNEKRQKLHIAANLHDLGKLYIPNVILEKPGSLDKSEFNEIKKHAYFTKLALDKIPGFEDVSKWAANHHEKLNGTGYPENLSGDELDFESRLMGVIDIYQALTEKRPYRSGLSHEKTMKIIYEMADGGLIDEKISQDVNMVIGKKLTATEEMF